MQEIKKSEEMQRLIMLEMMNLSEKDVTINNPLIKWKRNEIENPGLAMIRLMRQTDYVFFTCKHVLNVRLLPYQQVILQEMWKYPFPMLVATRGGGKSFLLAVYAILRALFMQGRKVVITGSGFRQAKTIMHYIETIWYSSPILRSLVMENNQSGPHHDADRWTMRLGDSTITALPLGDGCLSGDSLVTYHDKFSTIDTHSSLVWGNKKFNITDEHYDNGIKPTKKIITRKGYSFEGTHCHSMKLVRDGKIIFCRADKMRIGDFVLIDRSWRWHNGENSVNVDEAYSLGLMIGDGSYCDRNDYRIGFATCDAKDFLEPLCKGTGLSFSGGSDKYHWNAFGKDNVRKWLDRWNMEPTDTKDKTLPIPILSGNREVMSACLSGLFDTDGHIQISSTKGGTSVVVGLTNTSVKLMRQVHYILLHYGIVSHLGERERDENWNTIYEILITGPDVKKFYNHIGFKLPRKQNILKCALKSKVRDYGTSDNIPQIRDWMIDISKNNRIRRGYSTKVSDSVSASKLKNRYAISHHLTRNFLETYGHLDDDRINDIKILSDSDVYYDYIIDIKDSQCNTYDIHVPNSHEYCANGFFSHNTKIRGERAHDILADEFACLDETTLIETSQGLMRLGDTIGKEDMQVFTGSGQEIETVKRFIRTPQTNAYRIRTVGNYEFICSDIHSVGTSNGWKLGKDLVKGDLLSCPSNTIFSDKDVVDINNDMAWLLGILVAEGSVNDCSQIQVKMTDYDCIKRIIDTIKKLDCTLNPGIIYKEAYIDEREWNCKESWTCYIGVRHFRDRLNKLGLDNTTAHGKKIPWSVMMSSQKSIIRFLSGLFEGDGSAFLWTDKKVTNKFGVAYYSVSEQLCREVQILLRKFGFFSTRQKRRSKISKNWQWIVRLNGLHAIHLAELLEISKWDKILSLANRTNTMNKYNGVVWDKSRNKWKAETRIDGVKKYVGRFNTQQEAMIAIENINNTQIEYLKVKSVEKLEGQRVLYDYYLPKSHTFIGNGFLQHNSIPRETFETVVAGFGVVELQPYDKVERQAEISVMRKMGHWTAEMEEAARAARIGNQSIISGTAYFQFNHFAEYWRRWHGIISSRGDKEKLSLIVGPEAANDVDWRDYLIIRLPVELLPKGYMDERHVARSRATVHSGTFLNEFGAVFSSDSNGFFKRSLVEECVTNVPIEIGGEDVIFRCAVRGDHNGRYVFGVDPASEKDRFSIIILEVHETHRRIVYCWTTDKYEHTRRVDSGIEVERDFYGFCARKIRDLMKVFPCEHIALDSQGGGTAVREALHDPEKLQRGEMPIWEIKGSHPFSDGKEKATDRYAGLHILELCNFARAEYTAEANHGLRKDFEDKVTLFPMANDTVTLAVTFEQDQIAKRSYDTYEDCFNEIQELKEELSTIVHTQTPGSNRDRWDTPEIKLAGSRKGRQRKDRYSALVMANYAARRFARTPEEVEYKSYGGFIGQIKNRDRELPAYVSGPDWFVNPANASPTGYGKIIRRGVK